MFSLLQRLRRPPVWLLRPDRLFYFFSNTFQFICSLSSGQFCNGPRSVLTVRCPGPPNTSWVSSQCFRNSSWIVLISLSPTPRFTVITTGFWLWSPVWSMTTAAGSLISLVSTWLLKIYARVCPYPLLLTTCCFGSCPLLFCTSLGTMIQSLTM